MQQSSVSPAWRRGQRGSSLVEGALCFTVFLMLVFGVIDFGRFVFAYNFVSFGAREGARYAIAHGSSSKSPATSDTISAAVTKQAVGLNSSDITTTTTWSPDNNAGSTVTVKVRYAFSALVPFFPVSSLNVQSTSKMIISE
jgi:Flp pilus assembly protein TadG